MRYTVSDVKKACTGVLRAAFPNMPVYDNDTVDGYQRPSFFVEIMSSTARLTVWRSMRASAPLSCRLSGSSRGSGRG